MRAEGSRSAKALQRAVTTALLSILLASCTSTSDPVLELRAAAEQEVAAKAAELSLAAEEERTSGNGAAEPVKTAETAATSSDTKIAAKHDDASAKTAKIAIADGDDAKTADTKATGDADEATEAKRRSFLSAFFSPGQAQPAAAAIALKKAAAPTEDQEDTAKPLVDKDKSAKPLVKLASAEAGDPEPMRAALTSMDALPGVRSGDQLFEISRKSGADDDSDVDVYENPGSYQVASAAGLARMGAHGLIRQRPDVDVGCLKPGLVNMLHKIERHYGKKILVTSGYRSPSHNRAVRGARKSQHMYCAAADIKVEGVSKWELARYVRALPGRGGVGTYCHTNAIHLDVGPERDWNWRCRRRGG